MRLEVLYEDNHLLAVAKPAGIATMGAVPGQPSLLLAAKQYIKHKHRKPGNVYLGVVSRLDAPVTGAVVFARTSKAAARLSAQFREGRVHKSYWAVIERVPEPDHGACSDWLRKDDVRHRMEVVEQGISAAQEARLEYRVLQRLARGALLEVVLRTGRKHQIRVQLASRGWPILGDAKYGSRVRFGTAIALHARAIELTHPVHQTRLRWVAPLPESWQRFGIAAEILES